MQNIFKTLLIIMLCAGFASCSCNQKPQNLSLSEAAFDYFTYQGKDTLYARHPLTAENQFYNPILQGWNSDPSVCSNGKDYFLITSSFVYYPGVPLYHSTDLVNWKQVSYVLNRPSQLANLRGQKTNSGIYAPAISYNQHNNTYYMVSTDVGMGNFFVKTNDPFGEWSDPILLPDIKGIDPSFFFDDDGKAYIVHNGDPEISLYEGHHVIKIRQFDTQTDQTFGEEKILVDGGVDITQKPIWIEGPHLYKINGKYILIAAEGGTAFEHSEVVFASQAVMGTYTAWKNNPILTQRHLPNNRADMVTCAGHADMIQDEQGNWWAFFLACRPIADGVENLGRETFMMPVRWSDDGFPYITQGNEQVPMIIEKEGAKRSPETLNGNWTLTDHFDSTNLNLAWMTLRTPPSSDILSKNEGFVTLAAAETPAFVARTLRHHLFECETKLFFASADNTEHAGLLLYKDETHQYALTTSGIGSDKKVQLTKIGETNEILATASLSNADNSPIYLKIASEGLTFNFSYATKAGQWQLLASNIDADYLSTKNAWGFTGTTVGPYTAKQ